MGKTRSRAFYAWEKRVRTASRSFYAWEKMSFFLVKKKLLRRFGGAVAIIDASSSALGKTCWDIEADTSLEFAVNVVAKVAVLVKELEKTS